ncbi:ABC transporter family substrate-binding protein [Planosporangium thailandense]|uniref:ABC transporter family substrate-binding protein n=1 Tax=Planosporangium thailandense TaxID=765197 RepID=A0ABX0XZN1_9ACTN|nr:ABC transporter family substrate-binding protein [Planosporangium thailandense]NJC71535.1 ABC transporter family substrate-binding protein [Planosporangium thailandense]
MHTGKRLAGAVVAAGVSLLVVSACGSGGSSNNGKTVSSSFADCATKPNTCNSGDTKSGGTFTFTIEKTIDNWNQNDGDGNTQDFGEVLDGVLPSVFNGQPDLGPALNTDLVTSAQQTSANPQTIVYKINPKAVWDDGTPVTADDFVYAWKTQNGKDCKDCNAASTSGYDQMKSVTGSDNGKTVTVVYDTPFTDWKQPFGPLYPAHIAQQHGDLAASWKWFGENPVNYSAGPYKISDYQKDVSVTEVPNPKWWGKKPSLDKLVFRIITDQNQEVPALQNNEVQAIYPQPNQDLVNQVKALAPNVQYTLGKGLTWEHLDLNLKNKFLADKTLRQAVFTAVNRQAIIDKTVGQFAPGIKPLNNHNFMPGQAGYKDTVTASGAGNGDIEKAKKLLTDAGYKGVGTALTTAAGEPVTMRISYTIGNTLRQASAELFQNEMQQLGIKVTITPIQSLGKTLSAGDFDAIIYAWVGTPFPFAGAVQIWTEAGGSDYGHWSNPQADALTKQAASESDLKKATDLLNQADQMLSNDYYSLPLFQKPTFLAVYSQFANIRDNATNVGPAYNDGEWGLRASAK